MDNEERRDWQEVVDRNPQGYCELQTPQGDLLHGPVEKVEIDPSDFVHIHLKWAATSQAPPHPGFGRWINAPDRREVIFPNLVIPFVFEGIPEKGPRVRFGLNILYLNPIEGLPPSRVEGLDLSEPDVPSNSAVLLVKKAPEGGDDSSSRGAVDRQVASFLRDKLGSGAERVIAYLQAKTFCSDGQIAIGSIFVFAAERGVSVDAVIAQADNEYERSWQYKHPEVRGSADAPGAIGIQNRVSLENIYSALGIPSPAKK